MSGHLGQGRGLCAQQLSAAWRRGLVVPEVPETHLTPCPAAESHSTPSPTPHFFMPHVGCQLPPEVPPVGNWQKPAAVAIDVSEIRSNVLAEDREDSWILQVARGHKAGREE